MTFTNLKKPYIISNYLRLYFKNIYLELPTDYLILSFDYLGFPIKLSKITWEH